MEPTTFSQELEIWKENEQNGAGHREQTKIEKIVSNMLAVNDKLEDTLYLHKIDFLPPGIDALTNLSTLKIENSSIENLPKSFCKLPHLTTFILSGNDYLTSLPRNIGDLRNLQFLDLSSSPMEELPNSIGNLSLLEEIDASSTLLENLPESFCNLSKLRQLNISSTPIKELPLLFGRLTALEELNASHTSLSTLPDSIGSLTQIKSLNLDCSEIEILPDSIRYLDLNAISLELTPIMKTPIAMILSKKIMEFKAQQPPPKKRRFVFPEL